MRSGSLPGPCILAACVRADRCGLLNIGGYAGLIASRARSTIHSGNQPANSRGRGDDELAGSPQLILRCCNPSPLCPAQGIVLLASAPLTGKNFHQPFAQPEGSLLPASLSTSTCSISCNKVALWIARAHAKPLRAAARWLGRVCLQAPIQAEPSSGEISPWTG